MFAINVKILLISVIKYDIELNSNQWSFWESRRFHLLSFLSLGGISYK